MCRDISKQIKWYKEKRIDDGILRHPTDSITWESFDE